MDDGGIASLLGPFHAGNAIYIELSWWEQEDFGIEDASDSGETCLKPDFWAPVARKTLQFQLFAF